MELNELQVKIAALAEEYRQPMTDFLSDLIRIQSYTGQEKPAVERTLAGTEKNRL